MKSLFLSLVICLFVVQTTFAQHPPSFATALMDSILACYNAENYSKLISYEKTGLPKAAKELGKQDTVYARMLYLMGYAYRELQHYDIAESYINQAIAIQKVKIPKAPKYANSLNVLASLYWTLGRMKEAEIAYQKALAIRKEAFGDKHINYASSLNNLAGLYGSMGRYADAEPLFKEAVEIQKKIHGTRSPDYAMGLNNLAILYTDMGQYTEAEPLFKESTSIRKETVGTKHALYASSLNNLANLYWNMERYDDAELLFKDALLLRKEILGIKHPEYANTLNNLALLYKHTERYEASETFYKEALKIKKEVFGTMHPDYANSLNNFANLYLAMERYADAEVLFKEAVAIRKEIFGIHNHDYLSSVNNLAISYFNMQRNTEAWNWSKHALMANSGLDISLNISKNWVDSLANANYVFIGETTRTLGMIYDLLGQNNQKSEQIIVTDLVLELLKRNRDGFLGEADKLRLLSESSNWVSSALKVLDKNTQADKAFLFAEQSKSVLLMDAVKTSQAYRIGDLPDSLLIQEQNLQEKHSELEAAILEKRPENEKDSLRSELNNLRLRIKNFKAVIEKNYPQYAALQYEQKDAAASEIQALLEDNTALLEYVIGDSVVYIFYLDKNGIQLHEFFVSNKTLKEKIQTLHQSLSNYQLLVKSADKAYHLYTETAHWFYKNLVAIAIPKAHKISNLIIVTDGELGHLPFETFLVNPAPQAVSDYATMHYLVRDYNISYNYSATLFATALQSPKRTNNTQVFAMAANYATNTSVKKSLRLPSYQRLRKLLQPLPAAQKEVTILSENFQGFFGLNDLASEKIFKEKAADFGIIHLAMHGLLDKENPIFSSLVFTEDGDSMENNFLQAYEISKMKLNADLVVLSACETGYGRFEKGNGIASLARAFMYAGVPSLVVSLWQVHDNSTAEIMKYFYDNLTAGMPKDAALRQAKLDYLKHAKGIFAHPAFWSPFIQLGDSRPIQVETKFIASKTWWGIGSISLLILGIGGMAWRKRQV